MLYLIYYSDIIMLKIYYLFVFVIIINIIYVDNEEIQNIIYYNFKFLNDIILFLFIFKLIFDLKTL